MNKILVGSRMAAIAGLLLWKSLSAFAVDPQAIMNKAQSDCAAFLASIHDIQLEQTMTMTASGDSSVINQRIYRRGDLVRTEIRAIYPPSPLGSAPTVVIGNGQQSWLISVTNKRELSPEEAQEFQSEKLCWDFAGQNAEAVGFRSVKGRDLIEIRMSEGENSYAIDLDPATGLIRGGRAFGAESDSVGWEYTDFRDVGTGYMLPFQTTMYAGSIPLSSLTVNGIQLNQGISDDMFDPEKVEMPSIEDVIKKLGEQQK